MKEKAKSVTSYPITATYYELPVEDVRNAYRRVYGNGHHGFIRSLHRYNLKLPRRLASVLLSKMNSKLETIIKLYPSKTRGNGDTLGVQIE